MLLHSLLFVFVISATLNYVLIFFSSKLYLFHPVRVEVSKLRSYNKTPTFGGVTILLSLFQYYLQYWPFFVLSLCFAAIGFVDDFIKLCDQKHDGLSVKIRFLIGSFFAFIFCYIFISLNPQRNYIPILNWFWRNNIITSSLFGMIVIVSCANSFNLTDGVDALLGSVCIYILLFLSYCCRGDLPFFFAIISAILGFLLFNKPRAQIYMGDVGALFLGSLIGCMFFVYQLELWLFLIAIVPFLETLSVIIQLSWYRFSGKRLFYMTPIHHSFEKYGYDSIDILIIFNTVSILGFISSMVLKIYVF